MSKKDRIYISFILDETGSMSNVIEPTISGFNEYLNTLKRGKEAKKIRFWLTKFNSGKMELAYDGAKLKKVKGLSRDNYRPAFTTPLYDAIGTTVLSLSDMVGDSGKVLVVIQTDGLENASREFDQKSVFDLITEKEKDGWTFVFLGADQDAWAAGAAMGMAPGNVMSYRSARTGEAFTSAAIGTQAYAKSGGVQTQSFWEGTDSSDDPDDESELEVDSGTGLILPKQPRTVE